MDYAAMAKMYGGGVAPAPEPTMAAPAWAANLSPKDQAEIKIKMYAEGRKRIADLQEQIDSAGNTMAELNEFGRLNRENATGSLFQQITPDTALFRSGPAMEMSAITSRLAPAQREQGSGASSDRDVAMFLGGLPSVDKEGPVNMGIREDYERKYNAGIEKLKAMQRHLDQNGNLMDFDARWAERTRPPAKSAAPVGSSVRDQADAIIGRRR
jgi:hypothetical protein